MLVHHELCFGCGRTNLFGLLLEVDPDGQGNVTGRCFIKQDHQGAERGSAHDGVVAAALAEAMSLACGRSARARTLHTEITGSAPVGAFLEIFARADNEERDTMQASATASLEGVTVARASGNFTL